MYVHQQSQDSTAAGQPLLKPDPAHAPKPSVLRRSTSQTRPSDSLSLYATLSTISIPDTYSQDASLLAIGHDGRTRSSPAKSYLGHHSMSISLQAHRLQMDLLYQAETRWIFG